MTEPPSCYDVTVAVARDGGDLPDPAEFAVAAAARPRPAGRRGWSARRPRREVGIGVGGGELAVGVGGFPGALGRAQSILGDLAAIAERVAELEAAAAR